MVLVVLVVVLLLPGACAVCSLAGRGAPRSSGAFCSRLVMLVTADLAVLATLSSTSLRARDRGDEPAPRLLLDSCQLREAPGWFDTPGGSSGRGLRGSLGDAGHVTGNLSPALIAPAAACGERRDGGATGSVDERPRRAANAAAAQATSHGG